MQFLSRLLSLNNFHSKPSTTTKDYWIYAERKQGRYPMSTDYAGKWLLFVKREEVDVVWEQIKLATETGLLGLASKVSTAKENPNSSDGKEHVICVYTYDYNDREDVTRIREELRRLGIVNKIPYKPDKATLDGQYANKGYKKISIYYE